MARTHFISFVLFLTLASCCYALEQGVELVPIPPSNVSELPAVDPERHFKINLLLEGSDPTSWAEDLKKAVKWKDKGYELTLQFTGPPRGFASFEIMNRLAEGIKTTLLQHGSFATTCFIGTPAEPLDQALFKDPLALSFAVKNISVACRAANPEMNVYFNFFDSTTYELFLPILKENGLEAYIDGYSTVPKDLPAFQSLVALDHPNARVFAYETPTAGAKKAVENIFHAFQAGRFSLLIPVDEPALRAILGIAKYLSPQTAPTSPSGRKTEFLSTSGQRLESFELTTFSDFQNKQEFAVILPPPQPMQSLLSLPFSDADQAVLHDIIGGKDYPLRITKVNERDKSVVSLPGLRWPMILEYKRFSKEELRQEVVSASYELPLEIIMARVQAVEAKQSELLDHYTADARIEYHFRLPGGLALIDVAFDNDFFYDRKLGQEWRQKTMYISGVPWKGKKIPELPIPEPEKVISIPLNLTLNKDYNYSLLGSDQIDGHPVWVIEFKPAVPDKPLYKGKVWISQSSFRRVRISATQTHLSEPFTSNDETLHFQPVESGVDSYNIIANTSGQQIFSAGGRQVFAERTIRFSNVRVNSGTFRAERESAYTSNDVMLRDTDQGLKYLKKDSLGKRVVQWEEDTKRKFWVFGTFYDRSVSFPIPFGGLNILNYNWRKTGSQLNILLAGALNVFSLSDPVFLRKGSDARIELALFTVPLIDQIFNEGVANKKNDLLVFREFGNAGMGFTLGEYAKITPGLQFAYYHYLQTNDTLDEFRSPSNHFDIAPTLELNYTRKGFALSGAISKHFRSKWRPWGLPDSTDRLDPRKDYLLYQIGINKTFYPADLHKVGVSAMYLAGQDLDRFSSYQFFYLGDVSLAGFSGSGVRFERGSLLKTFYQFNVFDIIRVGGRVEFGRVQPFQTSEWDNHAGIGADGTVFGPWDSLVSFDLGFAAYSDIPAIEKKFTLSIMLLKLF
jgi:hypothetical protein